MFNAIKYSQELERAGFSREQAETSVKLLIDVMDQNLATKADLQTGLKELEFKMDSRFSVIESKFQELEYKLTIKLGTLLTVAVGAVTALHKML